MDSRSPRCAAVLRRLARLAPVAALATLLAVGCGAPGPSDADLPRVALFARPWMAPIYEEDVPSPADLGSPVRLALTPGEYEPASVGVRVRDGLRGLRLVPSALTGPGGATIQAAAFDVRVVRMIEPLERWPKLKEHPRHPGFLDPQEASGVDLAAATTRAFWVTLHAPDDAAAGSYRGSLALVSDGAELAALPLEVEVYPFRLGEARPALWIYGDNWPLSAASFADSRAHGMNTICVNPGWPKQTVPRLEGTGFAFEDGFAPTLTAVETARQAGLGLAHPVGIMLYQYMVRSTVAGLKMSGVPVPEKAQGGLDFNAGFMFLYEGGEPVEKVERWRGPYRPSKDPYGPPDTRFGRFVFEGWVAGMKTLDAEAARRGWQPFFYYLADEPHQTRGSFRLAMAMVRAAAEAGADSFITCNEPTVSEPDEDELWFPPVGDEPALRLEPNLKTRSYHNRYLGPETRERTRAAGDRYGTYINIYGNRPEGVRYQTGFLQRDVLGLGTGLRAVRRVALLPARLGGVPRGDRRPEVPRGAGAGAGGRCRDAGGARGGAADARPAARRDRRPRQRDRPGGRRQRPLDRRPEVLAARALRRGEARGGPGDRVAGQSASLTPPVGAALRGGPHDGQFRSGPHDGRCRSAPHDGRCRSGPHDGRCRSGPHGGRCPVRAG
ncbi:MAG: hypothetical protein H6Q01_653, partial [Acidobacteria bacterium]|nr:hypothetical protein [Acidobacteriota bacterium]